MKNHPQKIQTPTKVQYRKRDRVKLKILQANALVKTAAAENVRSPSCAGPDGVALNSAAPSINY
jgi:hypothetical protein